MSIVDITSITRTRRAQAAFERIEKYVESMRALGKRVEQITVSSDDRSALMSAASAGRDKWAPAITGISFNGVPIK